MDLRKRSHKNLSSLAWTHIYIKNKSPINYLLPLVLLSLIGSSIALLNQVITTNTRWIGMGLLILFLIVKKKFFYNFDKEFAFAIFLYISWCAFSSFWSDIFLLSFTKTILLFVLSTTMVSAGIEWVEVYDWQESLACLKIIAFLALISGFLGRFSPTPQGDLYHGLVDGSNMFGSLLAMSFPYLLWKSYQYGNNFNKRCIGLVCLASCVYFLILSFARTAAIGVIFISVAFLLTLINLRSFFLLLISVLLVVSLLLISPNSIEKVISPINGFIYKKNDSSVFYSREKNWQETYDGAVAGGWVGVGYGISAGQNNFTARGLTTYGYGREKGNSQLAIIEETGIIGFIFYLLLFSVLLKKLISLYFFSYCRAQTALISILFGTFIGLIVQSGFEAWWTAPGSPESNFTWLLFGIIRGVEINFKKQRCYEQTFNQESDRKILA